VLYIRDDVLIISKMTDVSSACFKRYSSYAVKRVCNFPSTPRSFLINMVVWFFLAIGFMFLFRIGSLDFSKFHWPSAFVVALPLLLFIGYSYYGIYKFQKLSAPNSDGLMLGTKQLEFDDDGIKEISRLGNSFYHWNAVEAVEENQGDMYIFVDKTLAIIIPSESFNSDSERADLKGLISNYV
jgi:hypothetical protein